MAALLSLEQLSGSLMGISRHEAIRQLQVKAVEEVKHNGGITPLIFRQAVVPLLAHCKESCEPSEKKLAQIALWDLAPFPSALQDHDTPSNRDSAAARCTTDPLCIILSMLLPHEFLAAIRCCKSWYMARLKSASWPRNDMAQAIANLFTDSIDEQVFAMQYLHARFTDDNKCDNNEGDEHESDHESDNESDEEEDDDDDDDEDDQNEALNGVQTYINRFLQYPDAPERLVNLLYSKQNLVAVHGVGCVVNITAASYKHVKRMMHADIVLALVHLLKSSHDNVLELVLWAATNIAVTAKGFCYDIIVFVMPTLLTILERQPLPQKVMVVAARLLDVLFGEESSRFHASNLFPALPALKRLLYSDHDEVLEHVCHAFRSFSMYNTQAHRNQIQAIIDVDALAQVGALMMHERKRISGRALGCIHNIVMHGSHDQLRVFLLGCPVWPIFATLLKKNESAESSMLVCEILSELSANVDQVDLIIASNGVPVLIDLVYVSQLRMCALRTLVTISRHRRKGHIEYIVEQRVIPAFIHVLQHGGDDEKTRAVDGLVDILRQGDKQAQEEKGTNPYVHEIRTCGLKTFQNLTRATINRSFRKARWMVNLWICKENENEVV